jgi:hypothetical protein
VQFSPGCCHCGGEECPGGCSLPDRDLSLYYDSTDNPNLNLTLVFESSPIRRYVADANFKIGANTVLCRFVLSCFAQPASERLGITRLDTSTLVSEFSRAGSKTWQTTSCSPLFLEHVGVSETVRVFD